MHRVQRVVGYIPVGFTDLLHVLKHPDIRDFTRAWLES